MYRKVVSMPESILTPLAGAAGGTAAPDLTSSRAHFPALALTNKGLPVVYADNPGGTQVPQACIDAIATYLASSNANTGGAFLTSQRSDAMLAEAHAAMADFLNAADPREIVFGANMTSLTFAFSRALGRRLQPGDEIVVTMLDHDANVAPWLHLATDRGLTVRIADIDPATCTLDMDDLRSKITEHTKVVAVGYASNAAGTINDVATIVHWAREAGAYSYIDAVHFGPHGPIDVQSLGCDFLVCSAYKFFAPHIGVLYGREPLLELLQAYKVRPASNDLPDKWETGTQNHECLAGLVGTMDYLAGVGREHVDTYAARFPEMRGRRLDLHVALAAFQDYERQLAARFLGSVSTIPGVHVYGLTETQDLLRRVPTFMLTIEGFRPREIADALGKRGIFTWDGNYYALNLMERLGLEEHGGALRIGMVHYNTMAEIDRLIMALRRLKPRGVSLPDGRDPWVPTGNPGAGSAANG
jgi:cysteine desulfurase family protein (TIGR01976 family)